MSRLFRWSAGSLQSKAVLSQPPPQRPRKSTQLSQVKKKLRKLPDSEGRDEREITAIAETLTEHEKLKVYFSHLYDIYDPVLEMAEEAEAFSERGIRNSVEYQSAVERAEDRITAAAKLPVCLLLSKLEGRPLHDRFAGTFAGLLNLQYGAHHAALMVGDVTIEWADSSLVIPSNHQHAKSIFRADMQRHSKWVEFVSQRRMETARGDMSYGEQIDLMVDLTTEKKRLIDDLIDLIVRYNKLYYYHPLTRNCQDFVIDAMKALRILNPVDFSGKLGGYFQNLKKGQRSGLLSDSDFTTHQELDSYVVENFDKLKQDDLEYFLCHYFSFHLLAGMEDPATWECQVCNCQMPHLEEQLDRNSLQLYKLIQ